MGAHSDLWNPARARLVHACRRAWAGSRRWRRSAPPSTGSAPFVRSSHSASASSRTFRSICGLHDSSASLLPHLKARKPPFTVVSTGTWVILFAVGGDIRKARSAPRHAGECQRLRSSRSPAAASWAAANSISSPAGNLAAPGEADIDRVLTQDVMALPTFVDGVGPFPNVQGSLVRRSCHAVAGRAQRRREPLRRPGHGGVDCRGRRRRRPGHRRGAVRRAIRSTARRSPRSAGYPVEPSDAGTGTTLGAVLLATGELPERPAPPPVAPLSHAALPTYVAAWRKAAGSRA